MKRILLICLIALFAISCDENTGQQNAVQMTIEELAITPGYTWFNAKRDEYMPNPTVVDQIEELYSEGTHEFLIFVQPSCSCPGTHQLFPELIKSFDLAGISETEYKIFSMSSVSNHTAYDTLLTINRLPAFFVLKNNEPVYSIIDTMDYNYIHDIVYPNTIEEYLLEALKN